MRCHRNDLLVCLLITGYALDDPEVQLIRYKPEGLDSLCRTTKFTRKELQVMYRGFKQVPTISRAPLFDI